MNVWPRDLSLICDSLYPAKGGGGGGREGEGDEEEGSATHINSETVRDSAKCFRRKRCAKDLGIQRNWNYINRIINEKVINRRKLGVARSTLVIDFKCPLSP